MNDDREQWRIDEDALRMALEASRDPQYLRILEEYRGPRLPFQHKYDRPVLVDLNGPKIVKVFR